MYLLIPILFAFLLVWYLLVLVPALHRRRGGPVIYFGNSDAIHVEHRVDDTDEALVTEAHVEVACDNSDWLSGTDESNDVCSFDSDD